MAAAREPQEPEKKTFKLLGILDVENIPCARESILYGSLGSVVAGLGHFLVTSRIRRSCDVGVGGFILVTLGCWYVCWIFQEIQISFETGVVSWLSWNQAGLELPSVRIKGVHRHHLQKSLVDRCFLCAPAIKGMSHHAQLSSYLSKSVL
ncbi:cytochrome c oxidase assembly protein COX20, mitochondrial isoform X1 [Peromyscus californicus insignis]|uniref:cytochrome c oxidase assembly protein COX20, mitochondrial isoform X1 n=1 Tax=Peromyscus californicus insignis TaxID=564181 RepID=UPI0022A7EFD4|nr:cytochrome c oxidase assembly protein COX20, mitochondrial isoform X1 [Peromyscus californicus insignis]